MLKKGNQICAGILAALTLAVVPISANADHSKGGITEQPFLCEAAGDGLFAQFVTALGHFRYSSICSSRTIQPAPQFPDLHLLQLIPEK